MGCGWRNSRHEPSESRESRHENGGYLQTTGKNTNFLTESQSILKYNLVQAIALAP